MQLTEPSRLIPPTTAVRESWLAGERRSAEEPGASTEVLGQALRDFGQFVAVRLGTVTAWDVPASFFWWVSGEHYLGELVIRHELTPRLERSGGHVGYEISPLWRGRGHGTAMLAAGLAQCRRLGLDRVLLTIDAANEASRRVCLANGGVHAGRHDGEDRYWITLRDPGAPAAGVAVTGARPDRP